MSGQAQKRHPAKHEVIDAAPVPLGGKFSTPSPAKHDTTSADSGEPLDFTAAKRYVESRQLHPDMSGARRKILHALWNSNPGTGLKSVRCCSKNVSMRLKKNGWFRL